MVLRQLAVNGTPALWRVVCCETFYSRLRGRLAALRQRNCVWMLRPCSAVHSMFLAMPIDVAFCDADGKIIRVLAPLRPWRCAAARSAASAWEFPAGTLGQLALGRGDRLSLCP
jgi:uncharacterized membrane protein (UPF0127 family)